MRITILTGGSQATVKDHVYRTTSKRHKITINLQEAGSHYTFPFFKSVGGVFFKPHILKHWVQFIPLHRSLNSDFCQGLNAIYYALKDSASKLRFVFYSKPACFSPSDTVYFLSDRSFFTKGLTCTRTDMWLPYFCTNL